MSQWEVTLRTTKPHIRTDERAFSECEDVDADNVDLHYPLPLFGCVLAVGWRF